MFCLKCGVGLGDEAVFCPKCGAKQTSVTEAIIVAPKAEVSLPRDTPKAASALACPHCGLTDKVQKVTLVVEQSTVDTVVRSVGSGSATTLGYGGGRMFVAQTYGGSGTTSHGESQTRLAQRLSPPEEPRTEKVWGWGMLYGIAALVSLMMIVTASFQGITGDNAFFSFLLWFGGSIAVIWYWIRSKMNDKERMENTYAQGHYRWETAARR